MWKKKIRTLDWTKPTTLNFALKTSDILVTNLQEIVDLFASFYSAQSSSQNYSHSSQNYKLQAERKKLHFPYDNQESYNCPITKEEFWKSLKNTKPAATVPDSVRIAMLTSAPESSDSSQKSTIDNFRLIGWKTIDFFSIMEFRPSIFDHSILEW